MKPVIGTIDRMFWKDRHRVENYYPTRLHYVLLGFADWREALERLR